MRTLTNYQPTRFMADTSHYDKKRADYAVAFIQALKHTKGRWSGKNFKLIDWQEQIVRDIFGTIKPDGCRQFTTAYVEIPKKQGKSELAAATMSSKTDTANSRPSTSTSACRSMICDTAEPKPSKSATTSPPSHHSHTVIKPGTPSSTMAPSPSTASSPFS